jgi:hypothetical protein
VPRTPKNLARFSPSLVMAALLLLPLLAVGAHGAAPRLVVDCDRRGGAAATLSSLVAARDALRQQRLSSPAAAAGGFHPRASVEVRGRCTGSLELTGPLDANTDWIGAPPGPAAHSGGLALALDALEPVTSPAAMALLPPSVHSAVRQVNLTTLGLNASDLGKLGPHHYPGGDAQINFYLFTGSGQAELFWNGEAMHLARFPNSADDQLLIPQNSLHIASIHHVNGAEVTSMHSADGENIIPTASQLGRWAEELATGRSVWAHGEFSGLGWADVHKPVVAVNASGRTISTVYSAPNPENSEGKSGNGGWFKVSTCTLRTPLRTHASERTSERRGCIIYR